MLYVLQAPDLRLALLRLAELGRWVDRDQRLQPLRRRANIGRVPFAEVFVVAACGQCGEVNEYEAAERLVEGEDVASDRIGRPPAQDVSAIGSWFLEPLDWRERCRREDLGYFPTPRPLAELRDRGHLPRPRFPSDNRAAYDHALQLLVSGASLRRGERAAMKKQALTRSANSAAADMLVA